MKIKEVATLTGVTVRTLHHYDAIGLLKPSETTEAGYRIYEEQDLERLQQIMFFRELEFSLQEIKEIMTSPSYNRPAVLMKQRELLAQKQNRLGRLIELIDHTIEGEVKMDFKAFDMEEIEVAKKQYAEEVKTRYGATDAYKESKQKTKQYTKDKWQEVTMKGSQIMADFAANRHEDVRSEIVQNLVKQWQDYITESYYYCTKEILEGLGQMYVGDERFEANIDQHGEGTAKFMSEAIAVYCE